MPLDRLALPGRPALDDATKARIADEVVTAAERIIRGKGATNCAIGLAASRVIEAVVRDEHRVLPVTSLLDGHFGLTDVCLSLPTVVDAGGVGAVLDVPLSPQEEQALQASAAAVRTVARSLGL